jgi:uncharacterized protein YjdB
LTKNYYFCSIIREYTLTKSTLMKSTLMKKLLASAFALCIAGSAAAAVPGNGYYRCHNYKSDRYVYVLDNKGKIDYGATSLELYAIQLWKNLDKAISDPATVLYLDKQDDGKYDITSQGTGINTIINYYVSIREVSSIPGAYYLYGTYNGITKYLSDGEQDDYYQSSYLSDSGSGQWRYWKFDQVSATGSNYFGLSPDVSVGGSYYAPFYADFPFTTASSGMKVYYVSKVDNEVGMAVMTEVSGVVPRSTPVIVKCSSSAATNNRLNIGGGTSSRSDIANNQLQGVYFQNPDTYHYNQRDYLPGTMRLLGVTSDGSLGYIKSSVQYVPRNEAYLQVTADAPDELKLVTQSEYDNYIATHPKVVNVTGVTLSQSTLSLKAGETATLTATVAPDNATTKALTWTSSNTNVATVTTDGKVTAVAVGTAKISATTTDGTQISAACNVTVNPTPVSSITLSATRHQMKVGDTFTLTATVAPTSATNKNVTWESSNSRVATVSATGVVTAVGVGSAKISVIAADESGTKSECEITVNPTLATAISLNKTSASLYPGNTLTLTATITPDNATTKAVEWSTANPNVATVNAEGLVTAVSVGETYITATTTDGSALSQQCKVSVLPILATSITIDMTEITGVVDSEIPLTATVAPDNATNRNVTWASSNNGIATVNANGLVTIKGAGECTITATTADGSNLKATCHVTGIANKDIEVLATSITLNTTDYTATVGSETTLVATVLPADTHIKDVVWTSSNEAIATVTSAGVVTIVGIGKCYIEATTLDGTNLSARCNITGTAQLATSLSLSETTYEAVIGSSHTLTASLLPANVTSTALTWTSANPDIATVSDNGEVEILAVGTTTITVATTDGSKLSAHCTVTGLPQLATDVVLNMTAISSGEGTTVQLSATVYPENTTNKTLLWKSSNEQVATVDQTGLVSIHAIGSCAIYATTTDGSGITATCTVLGLSALEALYANPDVRCDVYTVDGMMLRNNIGLDELKQLPHGLYIVVIDGTALKVAY